ncbi:MAG: hypothetical protein ACRDQW_08810, partial [Haloechinothrix sp.]
MLAVLVGLLLAGFAPGGAHAAPALQLTGVKTTPGKISFVAGVSGLPEGVDLADAEVSVQVRGAQLPARVSHDKAPDAESPAPTNSAAEARGVMVAIDTSRSMLKGD